ncbi:hypothetical protein BJV78DRAFT_855120 [Lactifluus subvellereus]|nr:hypothetical protein BJV78DRAFT_855120 [Lactifluus subvellereus]
MSPPRHAVTYNNLPVHAQLYKPQRSILGGKHPSLWVFFPPTKSKPFSLFAPRDPSRPCPENLSLCLSTRPALSCLTPLSLLLPFSFITRTHRRAASRAMLRTLRGEAYIRVFTKGFIMSSGTQCTHNLEYRTQHSFDISIRLSFALLSVFRLREVLRYNVKLEAIA